MKDYTKNMQWALVSFIDRKTQDDRKSKLQIETLFRNPLQIENYNAPNKEIKRYLVNIDDLEEFENFYNDFQNGKKPKNEKFEYILEKEC